MGSLWVGYAEYDEWKKYLVEQPVYLSHVTERSTNDMGNGYLYFYVMVSQFDGSAVNYIRMRIGEAHVAFGETKDGIIDQFLQLTKLALDRIQQELTDEGYEVRRAMITREKWLSGELPGFAQGDL